MTDKTPERRQQARERDQTELVEQEPDDSPRLTAQQIAEVRDRISTVGRTRRA